MPDITTFWLPDEGRGDWALAGPDLASGGDLESAVLISLFTDRVADPDDEIPDGSGDPRGWWGDLGRTSPLGSKIWLLERAKRTEANRLRAQDYARDCLGWMVDAGLAADVEAVAEWQARGRLAVAVTLSRPDGREAVFNYQWAWEAID